MAWRDWQVGYLAVFKRAAELVGLNTPMRTVGFVLVQAIVAAIIWAIQGPHALTAASVTRVATAIAPFAALPILLFWQLIELPARWAKTADINDQFPDLSIRELFFGVDPNLLDDASRPWEQIGRRLLDELSIGRLEGWGRIIDRNERRYPLEKVRQDLWVKGNLTYMFFDEGMETIMHMEERAPAPGNYPMRWADLRFNLAQVRRVWPNIDYPPTYPPRED